MIQDILERLAPVLGKEKTHAYWMAYLPPGRRSGSRSRSCCR